MPMPSHFQDECFLQWQVLDELRAKGELALPHDVNTDDADLLAGPDDVSMCCNISASLLC